ncbi:PREDICTED: B2 protein-like [Ipomoea nil]|uniref:B2 protein-like n=1 Tax=Ipomoea nil TaxID=35883 RepID=UPI000901DD45|nr:PREDICTED: B2 protein-like [Ipomoea nil]
MENTQSSFWQFSDELRLQANSLANLSLNDSIWSTSYGSKRPEERRNFEVNSVNDNAALAAATATATNNQVNNFKSNYNLFSNDGWKVSDEISSISGSSAAKGVFGVGLNGGFNKGIYPTPAAMNFNSYSKGSNNVAVNGKGVNFNMNKKLGKFGFDEEHAYGHGKSGKKNKNVNKDNNNNNNGDKNNAVDKRFKTLPPAEALPRNETVGGYIFVCNNDTMQENLKRQLFGLPARYRDSVRQITPGLPLFLYNYSTHQLHGVFEAASFGGTNIDPTAWEDKKNQGESRFPAQVRVVTRKVCEPLEEDSFRPILHHYDGPKFRLELNIPETLSLLDTFTETNA